EVLAHPQVIARQMIREMESEKGPVPVIGSPLRLADSPARFDRIPKLGQDNESILRELGYSDQEIRNLRQDHVIRPAIVSPFGADQGILVKAPVGQPSSRRS